MLGISHEINQNTQLKATRKWTVLNGFGYTNSLNCCQPIQITLLWNSCSCTRGQIQLNIREKKYSKIITSIKDWSIYMIFIQYQFNGITFPFVRNLKCKFKTKSNVKFFQIKILMWFSTNKTIFLHATIHLVMCTHLLNRTIRMNGK